VSSVITGATRVAHIESNLKAMDVEWDEDVLAKIDAIVPSRQWR